MSVSARLTAVGVLAIHLAALVAPCTTVAPDGPAHSALLADSATQPCPAHRSAPDAPSTWLDSLCPCGCQTGAPPGHDGARTSPALLLAEIALVHPPAHPLGVARPLQPARFAPASPDHVPLATA